MRTGQSNDGNEPQQHCAEKDAQTRYDKQEALIALTLCRWIRAPGGKRCLLKSRSHAPVKCRARTHLARLFLLRKSVIEAGRSGLPPGSLLWRVSPISPAHLLKLLLLLRALHRVQGGATTRTIAEITLWRKR